MYIFKVPAIVIEDPDNAMNGTEGVRYRLRPEDIGTFGINTTSGQVSVQSADLDREKRAVYTLQVKMFANFKCRLGNACVKGYNLITMSIVNIFVP